MIHVVFLLAIDYDRGGWLLTLSGEGIISRVFQKGHMEDWVDPYGVREAEADSIWCA